MSIHGKSALIILGTLLIGIVIGVFLAGPVVHHRMQPHIPGRGPEAITPMLERLIEPSPDQEEAVREVLERHSKRLAEMHKGYRDDMVAMMDSLRKDLDPILTEEQKARLDEARGRFRDFTKKKRGPHGPFDR
jgi:hypothetical protein